MAGPEGVASMTLAEMVVWICLAALLGLAIGALTCFKVIRRQDRLNLNSAEHRASEIVIQANKQSENLIKESELHAKDELFKKREEFNREIEQARTEVREQERRLDKREDSLEQKHQTQV